MSTYAIINVFLTLINIGVLYVMSRYVDKSTENSKKLLEALKEEAKRRGFKKGVKYNYVDKPYLIKMFKDELELGCSSDLTDLGHIILENGVWAEVIKEEKPTQEEIDRVLDYLKNKNNS